MSELSTQKPEIGFRFYTPGDYARCLEIFDANCPAYFAPNERADLDSFLDQHGANYEVCVQGETVVGSFCVLSEDNSDRCELRWIMLDPLHQGHGAGALIMRRAWELACEREASCIDIAASQYSATFFARFGATETKRTPDGWGPVMDRVDMVLDPAKTSFTQTGS